MLKQVFILGKTKSGKTSLAVELQKQLKGFTLYEAGSWARKEFAEVNTGTTEEMSQEFKDNLTKFALEKLRILPSYSYGKYLEFREKHKPNNLIIAGVRNPFDFENMHALAKQNIYIYLESEQIYKDGALVKFEEGIDKIMQIIQNKPNHGMYLYKVAADASFEEDARKIAGWIL